VFSGFIQTLIFITLTMVFIGNEMTDDMKNS
jgi:F-type H+-transporting ATPase subunit a